MSAHSVDKNLPRVRRRCMIGKLGKCLGKFLLKGIKDRGKGNAIVVERNECWLVFVNYRL
jgi:hypothetical protein